MGEKREKMVKQKEEELDNWARQKNERLKRLHKLRAKLNGGKEKTDSESKSADASSVSVAVIESQNEEGYTRLEDIPGETPSAAGSVSDLRELSTQPGSTCCGCAVQ